MKSELTSLFLTFVLGVLAIAGVFFALQTIFLTREFRTLSMQATVANNSLLQAQSLAANSRNYLPPSSPNPPPAKIIFTNMNEPHSLGEISDQVTALRRQVFILLVALVIVSGTVTVFLYRQATLTRRDITAIKPQAQQVIQAFSGNYQAITNFVQHLVIYGQTHPDFDQQVLKKYNITPPAATSPKK